jgi:hypothetical protein
VTCVIHNASCLAIVCSYPEPSRRSSQPRRNRFSTKAKPPKRRRIVGRVDLTWAVSDRHSQCSTPQRIWRSPGLLRAIAASVRVRMRPFRHELVGGCSDISSRHGTTTRIRNRELQIATMYNRQIRRSCRHANPPPLPSVDQCRTGLSSGSQRHFNDFSTSLNCALWENLCV